MDELHREYCPVRSCEHSYADSSHYYVQKRIARHIINEHPIHAVSLIVYSLNVTLNGTKMILKDDLNMEKGRKMIRRTIN